MILRENAKTVKSIQFADMPINLEVLSGGVRRGKSKDGREWESKVEKGHYGYLKNTTSPDGEELDVYVKPNSKENGRVYIVHQLTIDGQSYDEDKVMLGYGSSREAKAAWWGNSFKPEKQFGGISDFDLDHFKVMAYQAKKSKVILATQDEVNEFRSKGLLKKGIFSPVEMAKRVKESFRPIGQPLNEHLDIDMLRKLSGLNSQQVNWPVGFEDQPVAGYQIDPQRIMVSRDDVQFRVPCYKVSRDEEWVGQVVEPMPGLFCTDNYMGDSFMESLDSLTVRIPEKFSFIRNMLGN